MIRYRVLELLFLVNSMTSQALIKGMDAKGKEIEEGIAQKIEELPKELKYKIFSSALALRENPKYEVYRKFFVGSGVSGIALNANNTRAFTGSGDGIACLWDIENGKILKELKGHTAAITSVALSADCTLALTGSWDETARIWDINTGETIQILQVGSRVLSVALSAEGTLALTGAQDRIFRLYTSTGELLKVLEGHKDSISSVALSADGSSALTSSMDRMVLVWDILREKSINLPVDSALTSATLSADGTSALTGTTDRKILVWDAKSGALLNTLLTDNRAYSLLVSNDGKRALVCTTDSIQVWNTQPLPGKKETSTPLTELKGHTRPVSAVAFGSADFIASGSEDNTALIWKPFALEPRDPQENKEVFWQAYKETFSRPKFLFPDEK